MDFVNSYEDANRASAYSTLQFANTYFLAYRDLPAKDYEAIGALRDHPQLRQLGSEIMNRMGYAATGSKDIFWQEWDREQAFF